MKNQLIIMTVAGTLLFCSCKKSSEEVSPQYSNVTSRMGTDSTGKGGMCKGGPNSQNTPPSPEKVMSDLDLDKDLRISKTEAKGPLVNDFDRIDLNKDNFISLDELKTGCQSKSSALQ